MHSAICRSIVCGAAALLLGLNATAGDTAQPGCQVLREWPAGGPQVVWSTDLLEHGSSAPSVLDGVVYATGGSGDASLFAFNLDGRLLWRRRYGQESGEGRDTGPRGSLSAEHDLLVAVSSAGDVAAIRPDGQSVLWSFNTFRRYGGKPPPGGYGATPLRSAGKVILACGGDDGRVPRLAAVDAATGETVWTVSSPSGSPTAGEGAPALFERPDGDLVVAAFPGGVICVEAADGTRKWGWSTAGTGPSYATLCGDGYMYLPALGGRLPQKPGVTGWTGGVMLRVTTGGGYLELWRGPLVQPGGGVLTEGRLFTGDGCYDLATGRRAGQVPGLGGTVSCADGMLYYLQDGPVATLVDPAMGGMRVVGRFSPEGIGSTDLRVPPVIGEGRLILRDRGRMVVYDLRAEPECSGPRSTGGGRFTGAAPPVKWMPARNLLWRRPLPVTGLSAPVVHRGKVLLAGEPGTVVCYDGRTGALEWVFDADPRADRARRGDGVTASEPVASGDRVWARFAGGDVVCLGLGGERLWFSSRSADTNGVRGCILSDGVLVMGGNEVVGLDASTGAVPWLFRSPATGSMDVVAKVRVQGQGAVITTSGHMLRSRDGAVLARDLPVGAVGCVAVAGNTVYTASAGPGSYVLNAWRVPERVERGAAVRGVWRSVGRGVPVSLTVGEGRLLLVTSEGRMYLHDTASGDALGLPPSPGDPAPSGSVGWSVADRFYVGHVGTTGTVHVLSAASGGAVWRFRTVEPLVGMAFGGGRQFIGAGNVLYCIGGETPSSAGNAAVVRTEAESWFRLRGRHPVARVVAGEMPRLWLCAGPLPWKKGDDPLQSLGGAAEARPAPGELVPDGRAGQRFTAVTEKTKRVRMSDSGGKRVLDLGGATDGASAPCAYYMFTTVENSSAKWFKYSTTVAGRGAGDDALRIRTWVGGKLVNAGDFVWLETGKTPMMVEAVIESYAQAGEGPLLSPGFVEAEQSAVDSAAESAADWAAYEESVQRMFELR